MEGRRDTRSADAEKGLVAKGSLQDLKNTGGNLIPPEREIQPGEVAFKR